MTPDDSKYIDFSIEKHIFICAYVLPFAYSFFELMTSQKKEQNNSWRPAVAVAGRAAGSGTPPSLPSRRGIPKR